MTKFIAQFESKIPKRSAFLLRRDSLEKATNSMRLYKENKKRPSVPKNFSPSQTRRPYLPGAEASEIDDPHPPSLPSSNDAGISPQVTRKSAFAMPDPKPISISNSAAKQVCEGITYTSRS